MNDITVLVVVLVVVIVVVLVVLVVAFVIESIFIYVLNQHLSGQLQSRYKCKVTIATNQEQSQDKKKRKH